MQRREAKQLDLVLSAVANQNRRLVIDKLSYRPATISELAQICDITLPSMNRHLAILEKADLIRRQKSGRINFVALNADTLHIVKKWVAKYQTHWASRKESLSNYVSRFKDAAPGSGSPGGE